MYTVNYVTKRFHKRFRDGIQSLCVKSFFLSCKLNRRLLYHYDRIKEPFFAKIVNAIWIWVFMAFPPLLRQFVRHWSVFCTLTHIIIILPSLQHASCLVKHTTLSLLVVILDRAQNTAECLASKNGTAVDHEQTETTLQQQFREEVLKALPDLKTVISLRQNLIVGNSKEDVEKGMMLVTNNFIADNSFLNLYMKNSRVVAQCCT